MNGEGGKWKRFVFAYSANISAERILDLAIPVISISLTGGIRYATTYIAANSVPRLVVGPLLVKIIQENPRRSWCAYGNWIQAVAFGILAISFSMGILNTWHFIAAGLIGGVGAGIFGVALQATVKNILPKKELSSANSTLEVIDSLFTLVIPVFAGYLVETFGATLILAFGSGIFMSAGLLRMGLLAGENESGNSKGPKKVTFRSYLRGFFDALVIPFLGDERRLITVSSLCLSSISLLLIPVASSQLSFLGGGPSLIGIAVSVSGFCGLVTSFLAGRFTRVTSSVRWGLIFIFLALASVLGIMISPAAGFVVFFVGLCDGLASWLYVSLPTMRMATETSDSLLGIAAGCMSCNALVAFLIGAGVSCAEQWGMLILFVLFWMCLALFAILFNAPLRVVRNLQKAMDN